MVHRPECPGTGPAVYCRHGGDRLAITKLDGTAKGGVVLAIANQFKIPVKFIGVGEKMEDLLVFDKHEFVDSLFSLDK